jgi:hypothetical protein
MSCHQAVPQNTLQPLPFIRKNPAHQFLKRGVTGADDFMRVEPDDQLSGDKAGHIAVNNPSGLMFKL